MARSNPFFIPEARDVFEKEVRLTLFAVLVFHVFVISNAHFQFLPVHLHVMNL